MEHFDTNWKVCATKKGVVVRIAEVAEDAEDTELIVISVRNPYYKIATRQLNVSDIVTGILIRN